LKSRLPIRAPHQAELSHPQASITVGNMAIGHNTDFKYAHFCFIFSVYPYRCFESAGTTAECFKSYDAKGTYRDVTSATSIALLSIANPAG
jgi:hypothetical protein